MLLHFGQSTLSKWVRKIEAEFSRSVFSATDRESRSIEFDLSALLRGDPAERWRWHEIAVKNRILTTNKVRDIEGFNPRLDGDEFANEPLL